MDPWRLYDQLIAESRAEAKIKDILLGLSWSLSTIADESGSTNHGICFSPQGVGRTLPWAGTLRGRTVVELAPWIKSWDPAKAVVGALAINAAVNAQSRLLNGASAIRVGEAAHLRVFSHFSNQLKGAKVAVIGHYPGLKPLSNCVEWHCIERLPRENDLPDAAANYLLPRADWVFITASSIANKTIPHLLNLSRNATVVLMGPSLPWSECWAEHGVNYLAGVAVVDPSLLWQVAAEGGGTRLFDGACEYRVAQVG